MPAWNEEKGAPRTVGLGAAGDRTVDREVERDSLLCPDYLRYGTVTYCTALCEKKVFIFQLGLPAKAIL